MVAELVRDLVDPRARCFQGTGHRPMQQHPSRRQHGFVGDLPDAVVAEDQLLARGIEHPAAYELLDGLGRFRVAKAAGVQQEPEREGSADDRRRVDGPTGRLGEPGQPSRDRLPHAGRDERVAHRAGQHRLAQRAHGLDDDEGVALADRPQLVADAIDQISRRHRPARPEPARRCPHG